MKSLTYAVDIALCIDSTGSMAPIINDVKERALRFHDDLHKELKANQKNVDILRVRVIEFRDFYVDGEDSIRESPFFTLPQESEAFNAFVQGIGAGGGGDDPESGLEAVALAIKSDWTKTGDKRRHVIVVWTDTSAHPLEKDADHKPANYPDAMPRNFDELTDSWEGQEGMSPTARRLVIFAPDAYPWTDMEHHWNATVQFTSSAGQGLSEMDYQQILSLLAHSI